MLKFILGTILMMNIAQANNPNLINGVQYSIEKLSFKNHSQESLTIAKHSYANNLTSNKVVTIIPGYTEHCLYMKSVVEYFLEQDYRVNCYDLPGHGHSQGKSYDIDDFKTYELFHRLIKNQINTSEHNIFYAHSTGAVGIAQHLLSGQQTVFDKIILISPLTRSYLWSVVKPKTLVLANFIKNIPRKKMDMDKVYNEAYNSDPFLSKKVPTHWVKQLVKYDKSQNSSTNNESVLIIYGEKDKIIDWEHSHQTFAKSFPNSKITLLKNGTHHLHLNEGPTKLHYLKSLEEYLRD